MADTSFGDSVFPDPGNSPVCIDCTTAAQSQRLNFLKLNTVRVVHVKCKCNTDCAQLPQGCICCSLEISHCTTVRLESHHFCSGLCWCLKLLYSEVADLSRSRNFCLPSSVRMLFTSAATLRSSPSLRQQLQSIWVYYEFLNCQTTKSVYVELASKEDGNLY